MFDWYIDYSMTISAESTGGTPGGIRQDPPDKVLYIGVDITKTLADFAAAGGKTVLAGMVVPGVVTFDRFLDPAGNQLGLAEFGSKPT